MCGERIHSADTQTCACDRCTRKCSHVLSAACPWRVSIRTERVQQADDKPVQFGETLAQCVLKSLLPDQSANAKTYEPQSNYSGTA